MPMDTKKREETAAARFQIIATLLKFSPGKSDFYREIERIAQNSGLSTKTIRRYHDDYVKGGFESLKPKTAGRPTSRALSEEIIQAAIELKKENYTRSIATIARLLEIELGLPEGSIKRSTLQENISARGYSKSSMAFYLDPPKQSGERFQRANRNDLWQSDFKHGPFVDGKKTYLITFIDDKTRFILHSEFFYSESTEAVFIALRHAIEKYGKPLSLYLDNGSAFKSHAIVRACSILGIKKLHTKPYRAKSKGKVERYHQNVDKFFSELKIERCINLESLNTRWSNYLDAFYQSIEHKYNAPGTTPKFCYDTDQTSLRLVDQDKLDEAFLLVKYGRKVDKSGCVVLNNTQYVGENLHCYTGRKVDIVWDPQNVSNIWAISGNSHKIPLKPLVIKPFIPKVPTKAIDFNMAKSEKSRVLAAADKLCEQEKAARQAAYCGSSQVEAASESSLTTAVDQNGQEPLNSPPLNDQEAAPPEAVERGELKDEKKRHLTTFSKIHDINSQNIPSNVNNSQSDTPRPISFRAFTKGLGNK
jgi:transposase InsO family protein